MRTATLCTLAFGVLAMSMGGTAQGAGDIDLDALAQCTKTLSQARDLYVRASGYDNSLKGQLQNVGNGAVLSAAVFGVRLSPEAVIQKSEQLAASLRERIRWENFKLAPKMGTQSGTMKRVTMTLPDTARRIIQDDIASLTRQMNAASSISARARQLVAKGAKQFDIDEMIAKAAWTEAEKKVTTADVARQIDRESELVAQKIKPLEDSARRLTGIFRDSKQAELNRLLAEKKVLEAARRELPAGKVGLQNIFQALPSGSSAKAWLRETLLPKTELFGDAIKALKPSIVEDMAVTVEKAAPALARSSLVSAFGTKAFGFVLGIPLAYYFADPLKADELDDAFEAMTRDPNRLFENMSERGPVSFSKTCWMTVRDKTFRASLDQSLAAINMSAAISGLETIPLKLPEIESQPAPGGGGGGGNPAGSSRRAR